MFVIVNGDEEKLEWRGVPALGCSEVRKGVLMAKRESGVPHKVVLSKRISNLFLEESSGSLTFGAGLEKRTLLAELLAMWWN